MTQKKILRQWMGTRRYVYNRVLAKIKSGEEKPGNDKNLRNKYVTAKNNPEVAVWETETPKDIRAGAIRDVVKNYTTAFSALKNKNINKFSLNFSRKKDSPSIEIPLTAIKATSIKINRTVGEIEKAKKQAKKDSKISTTRTRIKISKEDKGVFIYNTIIKDKIKIKNRQLRKPIFIDHDCRLQVKNNNWYLFCPFNASTGEVPLDREEFCALDPGTRTFQTIYSEGKISQIKMNKDVIKKLYQKIDSLKSKRDRGMIRRKSCKKRERKLQQRLCNLIDDLHHKTAIFLTKNFNTIILPPFESQDMVKNNRWSSVNRDILQLKHYLFQQRLRSKCLLMNCSLILNSEEFTTQTCGCCGSRYKLGCDEIYNCKNCGLVIDRDVNASRNIFIKYFSETLPVATNGCKR